MVKAVLPGIIRLQKRHITTASTLLTRAFFHDPLSVFLVPEEATRAEAMNHLFRVIVRYGVLYSESYATSDQVEGLAIWHRPGREKMTFWASVLSGGLALASKVDEAVLHRMNRFNTYAYSMHHRHMTGPHWYLSPLGVDPDQQGQGFAGRLLRPMLERIRSEDRACYLETHNPDNVDFYCHFGFTVVEEGRIPGTDIRHWGMVFR